MGCQGRARVLRESRGGREKPAIRPLGGHFKDRGLRSFRNYSPAILRVSALPP